MRKWFGHIGVLSAAALLAACGGGGGSPGTTQESYSISVVAAKTSLPLNLSGYPAGIGAEAPFTTTVYVSAKKGDAPIPGGDDIFACNTSYGLDSGPLYYLDGDDEHEDEDGNPLAYRSITLGSNAGGNSFHFHAGDQAGVATITCSVQDPRDQREVSASVQITVGGGAGTGKAASVRALAAYPTLGTQNNLINLRTSTAIQAFVWDDANQPVPNPGASNLQVELLWSAAANGARLMSGSQSGTTLQASTVGGVAQFALSSGPTPGPMLMRLTADRFDNDISNGVQDAIQQLIVVSSVSQLAGTPPTLTPATLTAQNAQAFAAALSASGGRPPYTWQLIEGSLPSGLSFSSSGLISGFVLAPPGSYVARVRVTDADGASAVTTVTITVSGDIPTVPPVTFSGANITATAGQQFSYALTADGGSPPYTWQTLPAGSSMPAGLTLNSAGVISGTPGPAGTYNVAIEVRDSAGRRTNGNLVITVEP